MSSTPRTGPVRGNLWSLLLLALVAIGLAIAFASGAVASLFPPPAATEEAHEIRQLYDLVFYVAAAIFFVVEGLIIWTVVRYRRRPGDDELPPQTHGNNLAEVIWTVVPTIIVAVLFFFSWQTLNRVDAVSDTPELTVEVTGAQFSWTFTYLEGDERIFTQTVATGENGGLYLPVGQKIRFLLSSPDVIHSFYVPAFLYKRDVNPDAEGRQNQFEITVDPAFAGEVLHGQCAELCGIGHRAMVFDVHPVTPEAFSAWLDERMQPEPTDGEPVGTTLKVVSSEIAFDLLELEVPAGEAFAIEHVNEDPPGVLHDIDIRAGDGTVLADTTPIDGGQTQTYRYDALEAGTYTFICSIHPIPAMTGTLTVR